MPPSLPEASPQTHTLLVGQATLDRWPLKVVVADIAWGTVLCAVVAAGSFLIGKRLA
jgi:uncharacterized membrane protein